MAFNFFKKKNKKEKAEQDNNEQNSKILLAMPLFNNNESYDIEKIVDHLKNFWGLTISEANDINNETAVFNINNQMVAIAAMPAPVPKEELEEVAPYNYSWQTALDDLKNHTNHAIVSVLNSGKPTVEQYIILSKIICSVLMTSNCTGVYQGRQTLLLSKETYLSYVEDIQNDLLPIPLWVYIGIRQNEKSFSIYTYGLDYFDKYEMEIIESQMELEDIYNFMLNICTYVIGDDVNLQNGETIGYSATHKVPIKLSKGKYIEGETLKLEL